MFTKINPSCLARFALLILLIMGMRQATPIQSVLAATLTVTNTSDAGSGSLRQAIAAAAPGDTITFHASLAGKTIVLASSLVIDKNLIIDGSTLPSKPIISGNNSVIVFYVGSGAVVSIYNLKVVNGSNPASGGGGIRNFGSLSVENSIFNGNKANSGGAIFNFYNLNINNTLFEWNTAENAGGAVFSDIHATTEITDSTFSHNSAGYGGAVDNFWSSLTITNSKFLFNTSGMSGGSISIGWSGNLIIQESIFSDNYSSGVGGAISIGSNGSVKITSSTFENNASASNGGAIYNDMFLEINESTFVENSAALSGGAIYNAVHIRIWNSTFFDNHAAVNGGGIHSTGTIDLLMNSTLSGNTAASGGGINNSGTMSYANTIIANSPEGSDCVNSGTIEENTNNLVETNVSCGTPALATDPRLGVLTDNGGPTQTMALLSGSPAIDAGDDASCTETDQRGMARPMGTHCDIGAYEYEIKNIQVTISDNIMSEYNVPESTSKRFSYTGLNSGPVKASSLDSNPLISSERVVWGMGFDELMGYPADQLTNEYIFPYYNNVAMNSQLRIGNTGEVPASVDVYIGGVKMNVDPYVIPVGGSLREQYAGANGGPVRIVTTTPGATILPTLRVIWGTGYDELMGYPANKLTDEYVFPYYNNVAMNSQLRIGNTGDVPVDVDVYIGGVKMNTDPYTIGVGSSLREQFAGVNSGPVRVVTATPGGSILATMRVIWGKGYDEMMGYPANELTNEYFFPLYSNTSLNTQLRIGNTGDVPAVVDVYIGGVKMNADPYVIAVGDNLRIPYASESGPLQVVTNTAGASILATERIIYGTMGYDELMGYPGDQLTTEYLFPWYNNKAMQSQIIIGVP